MVSTKDVPEANPKTAFLTKLPRDVARYTVYEPAPGEIVQVTCTLSAKVPLLAERFAGGEGAVVGLTVMLAVPLSAKPQELLTLTQ